VSETRAPDLVASAAAALHDHKAACREPGCAACVLLAAAWRQAVREASVSLRVGCRDELV